MPLLETDKLSLHYKTRIGEKVHAVDGVSFALDSGRVLGVAGESGCGKSTLVNGIMGLFLPPLYYSSGAVSIDGINIIGMEPERLRKDILGKRISIIPQGALNSLNATRKIKNFACDVMRCHEPDLDKPSIIKRLTERFEAIGLDKRVLDAYPLELSGGMKQRVVIGISTIMNPRVVIADEPSSALDVSTQKAVITLLLDLMRQDIIGSMIFITHELPLLYHIANDIAIMYAGEFVETGTRDQIIHDPRHPYTRALMDSMLLAEEGSREKKPTALPGAPPNLKKKMEGCRFAPRCPVANKATCPMNRQEMKTVADRLVRCEYAK
ncbi:MAG: ATP-binding cassette domain-containing protein [Chitinivibrionales bacterium]|nr:ATP-binding cassette domain-containing protein [Chitinivibrionales bacterium]